MDIEVGLLEKKVKKSRTPQYQIAFLLVVHLILCCLLFGFYDALFKLSSYGIAGLIGAVMCGFSQCIIQLLSRKCDFEAILKFQVWGVINGFWTRFWTGKLNDAFGDLWPLKVFIDQGFNNPLTVFAFLSLSAFWEGFDIDLYLHKNFLSALKFSYIIWPIAATIQFIVLPEKYMVLFNTMVNFAWMVTLGLLT